MLVAKCRPTYVQLTISLLLNANFCFMRLQAEKCIFYVAFFSCSVLIFRIILPSSRPNSSVSKVHILNGLDDQDYVPDM
jgi:hypothetical protein